MDDVIPARHRKKKRYPNQTNTDTQVPEETSKQFSKRELSSNWTKYDDSTLSNDTGVPHAPNFEELLSAPASVGGHFLFNSEKSWEAKDDWYNRDEYFHLNLVELTKSLATIPFYERQNYSKDIFSSDEIEDMNRQAKYQYFKWSANSQNNSGRSANESSMGEKCDIKQTQSAVNLPQKDEDDLDELLSLPGTIQQGVQSSIHPSTTSLSSSETVQLGQTSNEDSTDDIQKWLDDVLVLDS